MEQLLHGLRIFSRIFNERQPLATATTYEVLVAHEYLDLEYEYKYKYLRFKYEYKYKYQSLKYEYKYKYLKTVLEYYSSTSTSTKYYNSAEYLRNVNLNIL